MRPRAVCAGWVELCEFNVSQHRYLSLLPFPQHPLDRHSADEKCVVMIVTHALVRRTRNLPSGTRASSTAYITLSQILLLLMSMGSWWHR